MTSYLTLIETVHLSCIVFELLSLISGNLKLKPSQDHAHTQETVCSPKAKALHGEPVYEVSSFSHSEDILGRSNKLNRLRDHNHAPFRGDFLFGKS